MTPGNWTKATNQLNRCLKSALDSYNNRSITSLNVLQDIESDLEGALKAVKALIATETAERNGLVK